MRVANWNPAHSRREFLALGLAAIVRAAPQSAAHLSLAQATGLVRKKAASPVELVEACLDRIDRLNPKLNAFITVAREQALRAARDLEAAQHRGKWRGPLHGVPVALKDNIDTVGIRTTGASELFKDRLPSEDAEVVRRLKSAGAIVLGKLNMHEFALGATPRRHDDRGRSGFLFRRMG
jgi:aspartyl-tRNA(Asn)/glutamyl-tRNA(Gln) amidotransferase subunit A